MKSIIGIIICILSIVIALWLGVWFMFIGGIVQVIKSVTADPINALGIACGIARFLGASIVGWFSVIIGWSIGASLIDA